MQNYVIGVDGGGTKTHCALFHIDGTQADLLTWGPTNHECFPGSFDQMKIELDGMINQILTKNNIDKAQVKKWVFGLAGVDTQKQHHIISDIISELGISNFILCNDAYLGVKAGSTNGAGICAINGTGCTVAGIDSQGNMLQIGGMGPLTGDVGGGIHLGYKVISSVYNELFKISPKTCLTEMMFKKLSIKYPEEYPDAVTEIINSGQLQVKELAPLVFQAADSGDAVAIGILEEMGVENANSINGMIHRLNFHEDQVLDIVLAGSIYVKGSNKTAIDKLEEKILERNPNRKLNLTVLQDPPVMGAVKWALE